MAKQFNHQVLGGSVAQVSHSQSFSNNLQFSCLKRMVYKFSNILNLCFPPCLRSFIMNNYWFFINLQINSKSPSPPTLLPAGLCTISGERKRKNIEEDSHSEDEECFMLRLQNLSSLKLALMRKFKVGNAADGSPICQQIPCT